jgi:hypothetical protein
MVKETVSSSRQSPFLVLEDKKNFIRHLFATVKYRSDAGQNIFNAIVHCVRKSLGKETIIAVVDCMNTLV